VAATVDEAVEAGADLIVSHHPLLLRGVTSIAEDRYKGALLARLIRANCALVAAHTNADVVETGTSAVLADRLGLVDARPIVPGSTDAARGLGRVGRLAEPTTLGRLARRLAEVLPPTAGGVRVAGGYDDPVETVAVCGGAGDSLLADSAVRGARRRVALGERMAVAGRRGRRAPRRAPRPRRRRQRPEHRSMGLRGPPVTRPAPTTPTRSTT
jgi:putative NIF3 family GTP cyclohydrolase 1 type 2